MMAVDAFWLHDRIFNTDHFVESLAPLPQNPAVSTAIATKTVEVLGSGGAAESRSPRCSRPPRLPRSASHGPRRRAGLRRHSGNRRVRCVRDDLDQGLEATWHSRIIGILDGDPAQPTRGGIGIDLEGTAGLVQAELDRRGIDLFADIETKIGEIVFIQADMLAGPRKLVNVFHTGVWVLPIIAARSSSVWRSSSTGPAPPHPVLRIRARHRRAAEPRRHPGSFRKLRRRADRQRGLSKGAGAVWDALLNGYLAISAIVGCIAARRNRSRRADRSAVHPAQGASTLTLPNIGSPFGSAYVYVQPISADAPHRLDAWNPSTCSSFRRKRRMCWSRVFESIPNVDAPIFIEEVRSPRKRRPARPSTLQRTLEFLARQVERRLTERN